MGDFYMKLILIIILAFGSSLILFGQDQIILNDSVRINCRIITINANLIQYKNYKTLKTEVVFADTIKGYLYQGKTYINSHEVNKTLFKPYKDPNTENTFYRLSFLIPGFSIENRINKTLSINVELGTGYAQGRNIENGYYEIYIFYHKPTENIPPNGFVQKKNYTKLYPFIKLELRQFYNLLRRQNKYRSTKNNTANYFSLYSLIYLDDLYFVGPTWGVQRNKNRFYFNLNIGGGIYVSSGGSKIQPLLDFKLGLLLN